MPPTNCRQTRKIDAIKITSDRCATLNISQNGAFAETTRALRTARGTGRTRDGGRGAGLRRVASGIRLSGCGTLPKYLRV